MKAIDREYTAHPFFGARRIHCAMRDLEFEANYKRISRLMHLMGIQSIYAAPLINVNYSSRSATIILPGGLFPCPWG